MTFHESPKRMYWANTGKFESLAAKLRELVPTEGDCPNAKTTSRCLDKFRRASNCYYDLYNNGLGNRAAEFRRVFGFSGPNWRIGVCTTAFMEKVETAMDHIVLMAAAEQKLISEAA